MNDPLLNPEKLQEFLRQNHLPTLDRFGQHFLIDEDVLENIIQAAEIDSSLPVIEIGAGLGVLTRKLAEKNPNTSIFAVELDRRIIPLLKERTKDFPKVQIIESDILKASPQLILGDNKEAYNLIGNIPYNISAKLLRHVLQWSPKPKQITFLIDAEVAKRISAKPPEMSILAISVQVFAEPKIVGKIVPPNVFIPQPKVNSAVLTMKIQKEPLVPQMLQDGFFKIVRAGFAQRRKTLQNSLRALWRCEGEEAGKILRLAGIDPERRAQTLTVEEWLAILNQAKK